jgi:hypothetical protein
MSGGHLSVDSTVLHSAAITFTQAADELRGLQADAPLSEAAVAVRSLQTGAACRGAQDEIVAETAAVTNGARQFSENLGIAARWYDGRDQAAAEAIEKTGSAPESSR